jgi:hypothetical protein
VATSIVPPVAHESAVAQDTVAMVGATATATVVVGPAQMPALQEAMGRAFRQPAMAGMPFGEAINLARFLTDTTVGYTHYLLGPDLVGGPVEIAGISRQKGFKWVTRKHYYRPELNPEDPGHAV